MSWPVPATNSVFLGVEPGADAGDLHVPISFDTAPDGRTYVLDAGSSRIVVFDSEGQYITDWGGAGSDQGEFDFGAVEVAQDAGCQGNVRLLPGGVSGSVVVDDEGFIYVADVGNRRIQKFAP